MNKKTNYLIENYSKSEIKNQRLNYKKIMVELKWKPIFNLDVSISKTVDWYKKNLNNL